MVHLQQLSREKLVLLLIGLHCLLQTNTLTSPDITWDAVVPAQVPLPSLPPSLPLTLLQPHMLTVHVSTYIYMYIHNNMHIYVHVYIHVQCILRVGVGLAWCISLLTFIFCSSDSSVWFVEGFIESLGLSHIHVYTGITWLNTLVLWARRILHTLHNTCMEIGGRGENTCGISCQFFWPSART